jgi:hypothetical protein
MLTRNASIGHLKNLLLIQPDKIRKPPGKWRMKLYRAAHVHIFGLWYHDARVEPRLRGTVLFLWQAGG